MSRQQESMTKEQMLARINLLADEIDANEEENRTMQAEIDSLYARIDAIGSSSEAVSRPTTTRKAQNQP